MAYVFGDGFDCYAAPADAIAGYWDSGSTSGTLVAGRFAGSLGLTPTGASSTTNVLLKTSGNNDALHHVSVAFQQTAAISGTNNTFWLTFYDGATAQCSVFFRTDGAIVLTSGAASGTALATYTGAVTAQSTWYQFEIEVRVSNTAGFMNVRKLGNTSNDFASATNLDTAATANDYANRLGVGNVTSNAVVDDLLWRSDSVANGVAWVGDIRCFTRRPASDAAVQWSRTPTNPTQTPIAGGSTTTPGTSTSYYTGFVAAYDGTVSAGTITINSGYTGNLKCSVFNGTSAGPTTVLTSATTLNNPVTGSNALTFPSPFTVTKGTQYWLGFVSDTAATNALNVSTTGNKSSTTTPYATFPVASPTINGTVGCLCSWTIAVSSNATVVADVTQDAATSYVYSSNVGDSDLYGISAIGSTPASIVAVTTRAYVQKSDAGTRNTSVQLKSGSTTVSSTSAALNTTWSWQARTDTTDPATGAAWTAVGVNNVQIGQIVTA